MRRTSFFIAFLLFGCVTSEKGNDGKNKPVAFNDFKIVVHRDEKNMTVLQSFPATKQDKIKFQMVQDNYVRNISEIKFESMFGTPVEYRKLSDTEWEVVTKQKPFTFSYKVSCFKDSFSGQKPEDEFEPTILENQLLYPLNMYW